MTTEPHQFSVFTDDDVIATTTAVVPAKAQPPELDQQTLASLKGAIFLLDPQVTDELALIYQSWLSAGRVPSTTEEFVQNLLSLCLANPLRLIDMENLQNAYGKTRPTILRRCKYLLDNKLMIKGYVTPTGKRRVTTYTLLSADKIQHPKKLQAPCIDVSLPTFENGSYADLYQPHLDVSKQYSVKGELFAIFTLAAALPSGKSGKNTETCYEVPIRVGHDYIYLEVRPTQGTRTATVLDIRILIAVTTIISKRIEKGSESTNPFILDFDEIVDLMTLGNQERKNKLGGSYKLYILNAIERWEATGFKIVRATKGFLDKFNGRIELKEIFRLITKLKVVSYFGKQSKTPGKIAIYLDDDFLNRMRDPSMRFLISAHTETLLEKNPFALRFNLWCRRAVQHNHTPRHWTLKWLHAEIEPLRKFKYFNDDLRNFVANYFDDEKQFACYQGYNLKKCDNNSGDSGYLIWADKDDRLVGNHSHYAYMKSLDVEKKA